MGKSNESEATEKVVFIRWRRWAPLVLCIALLFGGWTIDARMKSVPLNGFAPLEASLIISTSNVGATWSGFEQTSTWSGMIDGQTDPLRELLVSFRKQMGIRLSPQRWNTWLGKRAVLSRTNREWGLVAQPGVLLRLATALHGKFNDPVADAVFEYRGLYYSWSGESICLSRSVSVTQNLSSDKVRTVHAPEVADAVRIEVPTRRDLSVTVFAREGLPVEGRVSVITEPVPVGLTLEKDSDDEGLIEIAGAQPAHWARFIKELLPDWPNVTKVQASLTQFANAQPSTWFGNYSDSVWILETIDTKPYLAVPQFSLVATGSQPHPLPEPRSVMRHVYRSGTLEGWREPYFGYRYERCTATTDNIRVLTNSADTMARNESRWRHSEPIDEDVHVTIRISELLDAAKPVILRAAALDAIEGWDEHDAEAVVDTIAGHFKKLGRVVLVGDVTSRNVKFIGQLDVQDE